MPPPVLLAYRLQGGPKSKPLPNDQKSYLIVLKPVNEIRFIRHIEIVNQAL